ncbi:ATP-binding cassette domain-containing protein [Haloimpatiens sp. FM7315]|uniref:ATP-binding cassette domain-containing protein n=1 Tax=Haloimpatiens sp. FM7315 TaxID=3298609 RepID=UPI0035A332CA
MEVRNVRKVYGSKHGGSKSKALNGVSFSVQNGEFLGIMGPSGAGKSTLLNVISTIDTPTSGTISLRGKSFLNLSEEDSMETIYNSIVFEKLTDAERGVGFMNCNIKSLYLCVIDMERAILFYESFFEQNLNQWAWSFR